MSENEITIVEDDFEIEYDPFLEDDYQKFCIVIGHTNENDNSFARSIKEKILSDQKLKKRLDDRIIELERENTSAIEQKFSPSQRYNLTLRIEELKKLRDGKID